MKLPTKPTRKQVDRAISELATDTAEHVRHLGLSGSDARREFREAWKMLRVALREHGWNGPRAYERWRRAVRRRMGIGVADSAERKRQQALEAAGQLQLVRDE